MRSWQPIAVLLLLSLVAYSNHFQNSFHFDDSHTITDNPSIRDLHNLPSLLTDPAAFSVLSTHQVYRPVLSFTLALDYWLAGGLHPTIFHITTFAWYLAQLTLMFALFLFWFRGERMPALFAAALFGLHPVSAETVNYIIQRAEILSTVGVIAGLVLYNQKPAWRRYGLYLAPFILACLAKPPALIFPALLLASVWLYESKRSWELLRSIAPSLIAAALCGLLLASKTGAGFHAGGGERSLYWLTQSWVTLGYFLNFFWPLGLSADSDASLLSGFGPQAAAGLAFLAVLLSATYWTGLHEKTRPIAIGLAWFLLALLPTALTPLAEVANDHRMFFPFVGLTAATSWSAHLIALRFGRSKEAALIGLAVLAAFACGVYERNEVWRNEETLWYDVTQKSPENGRGWMNYGLTQMAKGEYAIALANFEQAKTLLPRYATLEVNLGIVKGALARTDEAESHFLQALTLAPQQISSLFFYGRWLHQQHRSLEAVGRLQAVLNIQPAYLPARHLLMRIHFEQQNWSLLRPLAQQTLKIDANDAVAQEHLARLEALDQEIENAATALAQSPSAEGFLNLSLQFYRAGRFEEAIAAAQAALRLRPDYAPAYNNIAAGSNALHRWDEGIAAAQYAVLLNPQDQLARNNLAWARSQKERQ